MTDVDPENPAGWVTRARGRSLAAAQDRADTQATRLVRTAQSMLDRSVDVTVPTLVAKAGMSTKTFYRHFASRDELMLAVLEEEFAAGAQIVARAIEPNVEPVDRFRAFVRAYFLLPMSYRSVDARRTRIAQTHRLRALYPERAVEITSGLHKLLCEIIGEIDGPGHSAEHVDFIARSVLHVLNGLIVDASLVSATDGDAEFKQLSESAAAICERIVNG
ncbi:MAG: TetR/AcrR family transcriptional regulator [Acidimicrobiia bacterium]